MLDIAFSEDACQTKHENGAENLSILRRMGQSSIFKLDIWELKGVHANALIRQGLMQRMEQRHIWLSTLYWTLLSAFSAWID